MMDKFDQAHETRQAILDLANELGRITSRIVVERLGIEMDLAYRSMTKMVENCELTKHGHNTKVYFMPRKTVTQSSEDMRRNQYKSLLKTKKSNEKAAKLAKKKRPPWVTSSKDFRDPLRDPPLKHQGGQGCVRRDVTIKSCMD